VDFLDFGLESKQQVIRHFYLQREAVNRSFKVVLINGYLI